MSENTQQVRHRTLTESDMLALTELLHQHHRCRFDVSVTDMNFMRDMMTVYKETRSEAIKWIVRCLVYGILIIIAIGLYLKIGVKQ